MAISAAHVTFGNFSFDPSPTLSPTHEHADVKLLLTSVAVIEIQNQNIGFTTVYARMPQKIFYDEPAISIAIAL